jgi:hypothetical protein
VASVICVDWLPSMVVAYRRGVNPSRGLQDAALDAFDRCADRFESALGMTSVRAEMGGFNAGLRSVKGLRWASRQKGTYSITARSAGGVSGCTGKRGARR